VDELDAQLSTAVVSYLNSRVSLNQQTGQINLPEILHWYRKDFEMRPLDSPKQLDVSLLLQLEPYLYPDTAAVLQQMLPNITEIAFTPFCWTFGYRFESAMLERSSSASASSDPTLSRTVFLAWSCLFLRDQGRLRKEDCSA